MSQNRIPPKVYQEMQTFTRFWVQRVSGSFDEGPRYEVMERFEREVETLVRTAVSQARAEKKR